MEFKTFFSKVNVFNIYAFYLPSGCVHIDASASPNTRIRNAFLDSISPEIVSRHALSYVLVQVTVNAPLVRVKLVRVTDNP